MLNFLKFFHWLPPLAVDIGDDAIEVLQLNWFKKIKAYAKVALQNKPTAEDLNEALKIAGIHGRANVILGLPESKVFVEHFVLSDGQTKDEIKENAIKKAQEIIPLDLNQAYFDFFSKTEKEKIHIIFFAIEQNIANVFLQLIRDAGLTPVAIRPESAALGRALLTDGAQNSAIIWGGRKFFICSIFGAKGNLEFAMTLPAETQNFANEIGKIISYYEGQYGVIITKVMLKGSSALLPGIAKFFKDEMKKEVSECVSTGDDDNKPSPIILGLALNGFSRGKDTINLLPRKI